MKTAAVIILVAVTAVTVYLIRRPKPHPEAEFQADPVLDIDMEQLLSALNQVDLIKQKLKKN